ncbi:MAG TPA: hypothetical protein VM532_11520, partial [Burkholderiales bacterium]|nr:hypothetical protein [Burkholderiales bacterium]
MEDKNELDQMFSTHFESTAEKSPAIKNHRIAGNLARKIERFERGEIDDDYLRELAEVAESHGMTISDFVVNIANVGMTSEGGVSPVTMVYTIDEEPTHITGAPGDESDDDDDDDDVHVIIELPQPTNWSSLREKDNGGFIEAYLPKDSATQSYSVSLTIHRTEDGQITDARIPVKEDLNLALLYGVLKYPWLTKADMSIV